MPAVLAEDIGYIVKNPDYPNTQIVNSLNNLNITYKIVDDSQISTTNFSQFKAILVSENIPNAPVNNYSSIIVDPDYYSGWSGAIGQSGSSSPLSIYNLNNSITNYTSGYFTAYTQAKDSNGLSIPAYYLEGQKYGTTAISLTSSYESGNFVIATKTNPRRVFFGLTQTSYWTNDTKKLFENSVSWVVKGDSPTLTSSVPGINFDENSNYTLNLSNYFKDPQGSPLYYGVYSLSDNSNITLNWNSSLVTIKSKNNWYGNAQVVFYATNLKNNTNNAITNTIQINVNHVNQPPVLQKIENITVNEQQEVAISANATDSDGDTLSYSIDNPNFTRNENSFTWTPQYGDAGTYYVNLSVSDGELSDSQVVQITVNKLDSAPIIEDIGNQTTQENTPFSFTVNASDPDNDTLTYSAYGTNAQCNTNNSNITVIPQLNFYGDASCTVIVSDGILNTTTIVPISISQVNLPPVMGNITDLRVIEGQTVTLQINTTDPDSDNLTYSINDSRFVQQENTLMWQTQEGDIGTHYFNVSVSDGELADSRIFKVEVLPKIVINEINANEKWIEFYSPDNVDLTGCYLADSRPNLMTFDTSITNNFLAVDWHVINYSNSLYLYCFGMLMDSVNYTIPAGNFSLSRIPDGYDTGSISDFILTNETKGLSNIVDTIPPVISLLSPENNSIENDSSVILAYSSSDDKAQEVNCSLTLNSQNYNNVITSGQEQDIVLENLSNGLYSWQVSCSDGINTATSSILTFTINNPAPTIPVTLEPVADISVYENQTVVLTTNASNQNTSEIQYSINDSRFTQNQNIFTWQTNYSDAGEYYFNISVDDGNSTASQIVHVTVLETILLPIMQDISPINLLENSNTIYFQLNATDPKGNTITFSISDENTNQANCTVNGSILSVTPAQNFFGNTTCTIRAYNIKNQYNEKIANITVGWINSPPKITSFSPSGNIKVLENNSQTFSVTAQDPDNFGLTYSWFLQNQKVGYFSSYLFNAPKGTYQLKATVTDGQYSTSHLWNVIVGSYKDFTCSDLNGQVCGSNQICSDSQVNSSDSNSCCLTSCADRPPEFALISKCANTTNDVPITFRYPSSGDKINLGDNMTVDFDIENNLNSSKTFRTNVYLYDATKDKIVSGKSLSLKVASTNAETGKAQFSIDKGLNENDNYYIFIKTKSGDYCSQDYQKVIFQRNEHDLLLKKINLPLDASCGDSINVSASVNNSGTSDEQVTLNVRSSALNIDSSTSQFNIHNGDEIKKSLNINIPQDASNGDYPLTITAYSDSVRTTYTDTITLGECRQLQTNTTTSPIVLTEPVSSNSQQKVIPPVLIFVVTILVVIVILFWLFL